MRFFSVFFERRSRDAKYRDTGMPNQACQPPATLTRSTEGVPEYATPPQIARELLVRPSKVLTWIRNGELSAINVSESMAGRPRWRIRREDLDRFLEARANRPPAKPRRRRNVLGHITEFFH